MTRVFTDSGVTVPVTVIEAGPCHVLQVREAAAQLGWGRKTPARATRAEVGHASHGATHALPDPVLTGNRVPGMRL